MKPPIVWTRAGQGVLHRRRDEYQRAYYAGIISERKAKALRPPGNDDAILRWNACARILMDHPSLGPAPDERVEHPLE